MTSELRAKGGEGVYSVETWGKSLLGRGNSTCKGPGAGLCLVCWKNSEEAHVAGAE